MNVNLIINSGEKLIYIEAKSSLLYSIVGKASEFKEVFGLKADNDRIDDDKIWIERIDA